MRNRAQHHYGRDGCLSYTERRGLEDDHSRSSRRRNRILRASTQVPQSSDPSRTYLPSEKILTRLKATRSLYDDPKYTDLASSPRLPSIYERDLSFDPSNPHSAINPHLVPKPLTQPCPHVYDSAPMRPVSVAIQEGVGMFLGDGVGRGSVFSKFW